jgi:HD superfamily phosphohydrolase
MAAGKTFNCPIHGHIELSPLSVRIIDTPHFQRLRDISQLGGVYYVFPGAASRRFEHCIGVAYLARLFIEKIHDVQRNELSITEVDKLCVEIAGLCHDLGHGPFSHLFDGKVLPALGVHDFVHEHASIGIFEILIEENNLLPDFAKFGLGAEDIHFIKELILGDEHEAPKGFKWVGRGDKTFLYDIVANKRNGIDVDKFDYFARDCHVLGISKSFDCLRLMKFAMVHRVDRSENNEHAEKRVCIDGADAAVTSPLTGDLEVCFHQKEAWNLFELFHTRYTLHKRAYQHRVAGCVELMISEVFILAANHIFIPGADNKMRNLYECVNDMHAYWKLGEYLLKQIENSVSTELEPARQALLRLRRRDMVAFVGEILLDPEGTVLGKSRDTIKNEIMGDSQFPNSDLFVSIIKIGYGKGGRDPVSELTTFYSPRKAKGANPAHPGWEIGSLPADSISRLIPREFQETYVRVYCRYKHQLTTVQELFEQVRMNNAH